MALLWRMHWCVPSRDFSRRLLCEPRGGIETSLDTARTRACATSLPIPAGYGSPADSRQISEGFHSVQHADLCSLDVVPDDGDFNPLDSKRFRDHQILNVETESIERLP